MRSDSRGARADRRSRLAPGGPAKAVERGIERGAHAVVLNPGSAKTGDVGEAIARAGAAFAEALAQTVGCALHLENTAGRAARGTKL